MSSRKSIDRFEVQYGRNLASDSLGIEPDEDIGKREERIRHKERLARKEDRKRKREARALKHGASKRPRDDRLDELNASDNEEPKQKSDVFVWKKRNEALKKQGIRLTEEDKLRRKIEIQDELERAKARRAQREQERAEWEAEQARLAREREQELNADWHRQEESFHGAQHFLRQAIRLGENRPTLLDSIAHTVRLDLIDVLAEPKSPLDVLDTELGELRVEDVDNLIEGVEKELDFVPDFPTDHDSNAFNRNVRHQYWSCVERYLKTIVEAMQDNFNESYPDGTAQESIQKEVDDLLEGKPLKKLQEMEQEISSRVEQVGGAGHADGAGFGEVDFWSAALRKIRCNVSRLQLKELTDTLRKERERLRSLRPKQEAVESKDGKGTSGEASQFRNDELLLRAEEIKGLAADEEKFSEEVEAPSTRKRPYVPGYLWNDKYRPRKPRYYNRVHTGYDWTKYNRTHYDHNNPPPKTVQGYKFNIFYPDLIDKSITPTFSISKTDNPEVCIITFKAGPPYEDIAFKIVNRPWEHSHRRGYRCSFDRGILYLWFNFQRYRYRR